MTFKRARTQEQIKDRKQEIINACKQFYLSGGYDAVNMKEISKITSISRASLYTYYSTQEEILLSLLMQCYLELGKILQVDFDSRELMSKEEYSRLLAKRWSEHDLLISLTSIHYTTLEKKCSQYILNDYKTQLRPFFKTFDDGLKKFFPHITEEQIKYFAVLFFSLMNGLYPMTHLSNKQAEAMTKAIPEYTPPDFYEISKIGILALLNNF